MHAPPPVVHHTIPPCATPSTPPPSAFLPPPFPLSPPSFPPPSEWPADALKSVASRFLLDLEFDTEHTRAAVEDMCMVFHQTVRTLAVDFQR